MRNIFISYARQDIALVKPIVEHVRLCSVMHPWFDAYLVPGGFWEWQLEFAISKCDIFLYVITQASLDSDWCQWELAIAVRLGKPIMPVMMVPTVVIPLPYRALLSRIQWVDCRQGLTTEAITKLISGLFLIPTAQFHYGIQLPDVVPRGKPPQARDLDALPDVVSFNAPLQSVDPEIDALVAELTADWFQNRSLIARHLAHCLLDIQERPIQVRFDKFTIQIDQRGPWSSWRLLGIVEPSAYEEFEGLDGGQGISEGELRQWIEQVTQPAFQQTVRPVGKTIQQKLVERGWDADYMTKSWPLSRDLVRLERIAYELIDTQRAVFNICLGEVEIWPHTRGRKELPSQLSSGFNQS